MNTLHSQYVYRLSILVLLVSLASCRDSASQPDGVAMSALFSSAQQERGAPLSDTIVNGVVTDFAFAFEPTTASSGVITLLVRNEGQMPHDFAIQANGAEVKTAMLAPGQMGSITLDLKPGSYSYLCTVPGHHLLGMRGTFTVE